MNVAVIVATCGDDKWAQLASHRAYPSARAVTDGVETEAVIRHYPSLTVAKARNALGFAVSADWLCFLDADDALEPGYLDAMRVAHESLSPARQGPLLVPMLRRVHPEHDRSVQRIADAFDVPRAIIGEGLPLAGIPNQGKWPEVNEAVIGTLVHRSLFEQVGGFRDRIDCVVCHGTGNWTGYSGDDEHTQVGGCPDCGGTGGTVLTMYEDWDLWLRCWDAGAKLVYTDAVYREYVNVAGRNTNAGESQRVYDAIWADHVARVEASRA